MSGFKVNLSNMSATSESLAAYQNILENSNQAVVEAHRNLDRYSSFMGNMDDSMVKIEKSIQELAITMNSLSKVLKSISEEYQKTEAKISGESIRGEGQKENTQGENSKGEDTKYSDGAEVINVFSDILSWIAELTDNHGIEIGGGILGLVSGIIKVWDPNNTMNEMIQSICGMFDSGMGSLEDIFNLAGLAEDASGVKILGSIFGISEEFSKASERNWIEQLKNSDKIAKKGGDLAQGIYSLTALGKNYEVFMKNFPELKKMISKENLKDVAAVVALASMATGAIGNVIERSSDGVFDWNDLGETSLSTGLTGMSSLIYGATFGVVDIDVSRAEAIFHQEIKNLQDTIRDTGAPLPIQVAMTIPGSVVTSIWATAEVFVDYGMQIGSKFRNWILGK